MLVHGKLSSRASPLIESLDRDFVERVSDSLFPRAQGEEENWNGSENFEMTPPLLVTDEELAGNVKKI